MRPRSTAHDKVLFTLITCASLSATQLGLPGVQTKNSTVGAVLVDHVVEV